MASASLLGGPRGSLGGRAGGHSTIQSILGQSGSTLLVDRDRENERTSARSHGGAVESSSESLSCSFSGGFQSDPSSRGSSRGGTRGVLQNDSSSLGGGSAGHGGGYVGVPSHRLFSSSPCFPRAASESCSSSGLLYPAPILCRGLEGTIARVLGLPNITGRFRPSQNLLNRSLGSVLRKGSRSSESSAGQQRRSIRVMAVSPDDGKKVLRSQEFREAAEIQMMKEWSSKQFLSNPGNESDASWEQLNMIIRVVYAIAMYGGLVVAGNALCSFTGVDCWGGFKPSIETFVQALGWAIPPMMALLLILEDEVVKVCPPARAIRDVEDEELMDFFVGMSPWQFIFVVATGSLAEELFFRVAIQGGLAHALQFTAKGADETVIGVSALTTIIPFFAPFAQAFAAVLTASLTGSMYYIISCPKDPTYVIAPVSVNKYGWNCRRDIKKRIEAWYERRQLKKIYSPLMEALLALYLGFEWVQTGNIFGPMITHTLYSLVVAGNGLRRIHDNRFKLRQRVSEVTRQKDEVNSEVVFLDKLN
ncbi:unnamed protein product [Calypogeia fissa]